MQSMETNRNHNYPTTGSYYQRKAAEEARNALTEDQKNVLDCVLNGEMSMSQGIRWAVETEQYDFADYIRTF